MVDLTGAGVRRAAATCLALSVVTGIASRSISAQERTIDDVPADAWFPDALAVRPLLGSSTRIDLGGGPIWARRDPPTASGDLSPEADAAFGYRLPLYRFREGRDGGPALDLSVEGGLIARFALGSGHNGLINSDFRAAFPLGVRFSREWEAIFTLAHVSSHAGDNLLNQTPILEANRVSRNGIEATALRRLTDGLRAYAGGTYNFAIADTERFAGRFGLNLDRTPDEPRSRWAVGAIELEITDLTERLSIDVRAGIGIRTGAGELQLGVTGHVGPSPMGQFRTQDEEYIGLFLNVVPGVVARGGAGR